MTSAPEFAHTRPGTLGGAPVRDGGPVATPRRWAHALRRAVGGDVGRNAVSLYGTTIITSLLGFAYWWAAARLLPVTEVGAASAAISAMQFLATFCMVGLNTLLIGELPGTARRDQRALINTAALACIVIATAVGYPTALLLGHGSASLAPVLGGPLRAAVFAVGVAVAAVAVVLDDASIGLLRGSAQLRRNTLFAVLKLATIPLLAVLWTRAQGAQLYVGWLLCTVVSLVFLRRRLVDRGPAAPWGAVHAGRRLDLRLVRRHGRLALSHHWLNVAVQAPRLVLPVIAAVVVGTRATASLYAAVLLVGFATIIPYHLSTVLFAVRPGDAAALRRQLRFTLSCSTAVALVSGPALALLAGWLLRLYSPAYVGAREAFCILAFTTLPAAVKSHYVAVARVQGLLTRAAYLCTAGAALEIAAATFGAYHGGITGLALGQAAAQGVQALCFMPRVLGAATTWRTR